MKKLRIYLDTSVIGGSFDYEFSSVTIRFLQNLKDDKISGVISELTIRELANAPEIVTDDFGTYSEKLEIVQITDEIRELAENYIEEEVVSRAFFEDAIHIACATVGQVDLLVSWNFKHIVNFNRIIRFNSVNLKNGYKALQIFSPMEALFDEN